MDGGHACTAPGVPALHSEICSHTFSTPALLRLPQSASLTSLRVNARANARAHALLGVPRHGPAVLLGCHQLPQRKTQLCLCLCLCLCLSLAARVLKIQQGFEKGPKHATHRRYSAASSAPSPCPGAETQPASAAAKAPHWAEREWTSAWYPLAASPSELSALCSSPAAAGGAYVCTRQPRESAAWKVHLPVRTVS